MSIPSEDVSKERKKHFALHSFCEPSSPFLPKCPFRDKVRNFLHECADVEDFDFQGMKTWCTLLEDNNRRLVVPLYTIEELVKCSPKPFCDHCRCSGWGNHYVSKRIYHFIIPKDSAWNKKLDESENVFDSQSNLLYGLIHSNGFGHLLTINGVEGGSKYMVGREIMDLWDRICDALNARKITVADSSQKHSMELRLLHGVAYRHPWFGRWGYDFCHGSFGVKEGDYRSAIDLLCALELNNIIKDFSETSQVQEIKHIIQVYRDLSETRLITLNDLLLFMLTVKPRARIPIMGSGGVFEYSITKSSSSQARIDVYGDVSFLYKHVLMEYPKSELVKRAVRAILTTKYLVKEWWSSDKEDQYLASTVKFSLNDVGETLGIKPDSTLDKLKEAPKDTYCMTERMEIDGLDDLNDGEVLLGEVQSGMQLVIKGVSLMHQGNTRKVVCQCGAREDDGERMFECNICKVWQHTLCRGIRDMEAVPPGLLCSSHCSPNC